MISDVRKRESCLKINFTPPAHVNVVQLYERTMNSYNPKTTNSILENWQNLDSNQTIAFGKVLELLETVYNNGTAGEISKATNIIVEFIAPKVRDARQMQYHIKRKLASIRTKIITKTNKKIEDLKDATLVTVHPTAPTGSTTPPTSPVAPSTDATPTDPNSTPISPAPTSNANNPIDSKVEQNKKKEETIKESMAMLSETANDIIVYDRIISNHNKLCKRYNIDRLVKESVFNSDMVDDFVLEFCTLIDTYALSTKAKYAIALENALFVLDKNGIPYIKKDIINSATDYFLMCHNESGNICNIITKVVSESNLYSNEDLEDIDFAINKRDGEKQFNIFFNSEEDIVSANVESPDALTNFVEGATNKVLDKIVESTKINKCKVLLDKFKLLSTKTETDLKNMVRSMFVTNDRQIVEDYPNTMKFIFSAFVITGAFSIGVITGVIAAGTNYFLAMHLQRKDTVKFIESYKKQKTAAELRVKTLKSQDSIDRCNAYIKQLTKDIKTLEEYNEGLLSDDEKAKIDAEKISSDMGSDDFGDFNFDEAQIAMFKNIIYISETVNDVYDSIMSSDIVQDIEDHLLDLCCDDLDLIKEFAIANPSIISPSKLAVVYENYRDTTRARKDIGKYIVVDCLNENIADLEKVDKFNTQDDFIIANSIDPEVQANDVLKALYNLTIFKSSISEALYHKQEDRYPLLEMNYTNTIRLAIERLKKSASDLSDSEKIASRTIDTSLESLQTNIEKALTTENREAVIRGNVLPPVSRIIKLAAASAVAWMISPALAVIVILGTFAMSDKLRTKERQIVLDELDVELIMVDKYIKTAEDKEDMQALRKVLTIKKKLEAQRNRLKYKMDIEWKTQSNPSSAPKDDDY